MLQSWAFSFSSKDERKKGKVHKVDVSESGNDECKNDDELGIYSLYSHLTEIALITTATLWK